MKAPAKVWILGSPVSAMSMQDAIAWFADRIRRRVAGVVCVADVHSIMRARSEAGHQRALASADLVTPDGTPLVWISRLRGERKISRVCGPDLMSAVCAASLSHSWRHYFYGGEDGVAEKLAEELKARHPGLRIAGTASPPFRPLTPQEDEAAIKAIRESQPDIVWVGLGCPKQERWMMEHADRLPQIVLVGVGAAFDFHSGKIKRAPRWMREVGLEWLHRLCSEPRRLWRRYFELAPAFVMLAIAETVRRPSIARTARS